MGAVATRTRSPLGRPPVAAERPAARLFEPGRSDEPSLEDSILRAWDELTAVGVAECPVCDARIEPSGCASCGSALS